MNNAKIPLPQSIFNVVKTKKGFTYDFSPPFFPGEEKQSDQKEYPCI